jgi:hypothetical protein
MRIDTSAASAGGNRHRRAADGLWAGTRQPSGCAAEAAQTATHNAHNASLGSGHPEPRPQRGRAGHHGCERGCWQQWSRVAHAIESWREHADATESVAVSGQQGQTNGLANYSEDEIRQRVQDAVAQGQANGMIPPGGDPTNAIVEPARGHDERRWPGRWWWRTRWWWRRPRRQRRRWRWRRVWRVSQLQSGAAAWQHLLSGWELGAELGSVVAGPDAGGEPFGLLQPLWADACGVAVHPGLTKPNTKAVCVPEPDRAEEPERVPGNGAGADGGWIDGAG